MKNELQVFNNSEFGEVRTIREGDKTLFCGADVAKALGYRNPSKALSDHCKGVTKRYTPTQSGKQAMNFIPEGDIYRLAARSDLPGAEKFERWIFDDILPALRRDGSYTTNATAAPTVASVNAAVKMILPVMQTVGIKPEYQLSVLAKMYAPSGLEIPLIGLPPAVPFLDPRTIARKLGVNSLNGFPHDKAIGAIIHKLGISEDEKETVPLMLENGRMQPVTRYAPSVMEKVADWLLENGHPTVIRGNKQTYRIQYTLGGGVAV